MKRTKFQCACCGFEGVTVESVSNRSVRGSPMGECRETLLEFETHRIYCPHCKTRAMEHISFLSQLMTRMTKSLERTILELRPHLSLQALSRFYHLLRHTIKELEKRDLKKKFSHIPTAHIKAIGIDEIHVGKGQGNLQYLTIVRDLNSGAIIHVRDGRALLSLPGL